MIGRCVRLGRASERRIPLRLSSRTIAKPCSGAAWYRPREPVCLVSVPACLHVRVHARVRACGVARAWTDGVRQEGTEVRGRGIYGWRHLLPQLASRAARSVTRSGRSRGTAERAFPGHVPRQPPPLPAPCASSCVVQVALCSSHYALLAPVAEGLVSLLFPFVWQGAYIPVMPFTMKDVLEVRARSLLEALIASRATDLFG